MKSIGLRLNLTILLIDVTYRQNQLRNRKGCFHVILLQRKKYQALFQALNRVSAGYDK